MKVLVVLLFLATLACAQDSVDEVLSNQRLYKQYFDCIMGTGKCTPQGKEIRDQLPSRIQNSCTGCTEKQKEDARKLGKFMLTKKPDDYKLFEQKYDPEQKLRKMLEL